MMREGETLCERGMMRERGMGAERERGMSDERE